MSDEQPSPAVDVFVLEADVMTSYMVDEDDRPAEATIVLDITNHLGDLADGGPVRVHLAAYLVAELADAMKDSALQSMVDLVDAKREADQASGN